MSNPVILSQNSFRKQKTIFSPRVDWYYAKAAQLSMRKTIIVLFLFCAVACVAVWAVVRFTGASRFNWVPSSSHTSNAVNTSVDPWAIAVEKIKEDRGGEAAGPVETPPELRHYSERYWFLATQVAEIENHNVYLCQDFLDLATLIQRGQFVPVPAVTDSYVLYGVGEAADDSEFSTFEKETESNGEAQKRVDPQGYAALQALASNFNGRSYDLNNPTDRQALRVNMLSALRPEALKIMEEVAADYHRQFNRPLPISSLVRPEQYQHALRRVNRNAVLIETPPHSTGLAFDIDYRFMGGAEQTFVMNELARIKKEGRIEVIRERNANYHVFAFVNGVRPPDHLIEASLEKAGAPVEQAHHAEAKPTPKAKRQAKSRTAKPRRARANVRKRRG